MRTNAIIFTHPTRGSYLVGGLDNIFIIIIIFFLHFYV